MWSLFFKELKQFWGSPTGYLAVVAFLVASGLFLWVFPGGYNIPDAGFSTLEPFFELAPLLYLFLIPAITMRMFADEKRSGTLELLLTRPVSDLQMVSAKFLAALVLVAFSIVPALVYYFSVWHLGNPPGNIDSGSTWGSFAGLLLLAAAYIGIGLFASSVSDSQIVAFILALIISFLFYLGFELVGESGVNYTIGRILLWFSISEHFLSLSRGVIDLHDIVYFLVVSSFFLFLAKIAIRKHGKSRSLYKWAPVIVLVYFVLAYVTTQVQVRWDLTTDKRYTLSQVSKNIVAQLPGPVNITLYLEGELPPEFRKLKRAIVDKVRDLNRFSPVPVRISVTDPYAVTEKGKRSEFFEELASKGIRPTDLRQKTEQGVVTRLIFPGALVQVGNKETGVNFLKNNPGFSADVNLNHSIETIEYELVSACMALFVREKQRVVFVNGHGELNPWEVDDLCSSLSGTFDIGFLEAEELMSDSVNAKVIIVASPKEPFNEREKFALDQAFMSGSRLMWLIDPVEVSLDSLSRGMMTLAFPRDLNLHDQLFHYGVRINTDLVQDVVCSQILVNTAVSGNPPKFTPQPWYYSPLLTPSDHHPVGRNLNLLLSEFVSSIDTVAGSGAITKTVILGTSPYGRVLNTPASISLESINRPPARELFNRPHIPAGVLLEGDFNSVFQNRMVDRLGPIGKTLKTSCIGNKMMVFSDGNLIANKVRYTPGASPEILPLGFDRVSQQTFGNKEFFVNAIRYLSGEDDILHLRSRTIKLRLLDKVRLSEEKHFRTVINVFVPPLLVILFGFFYALLRRKSNTAG